MEVAKADAIIGKTVDVGRTDLTAKAADVREAQVVRDDDEEVRTWHVYSGLAIYRRWNETDVNEEMFMIYIAFTVLGRRLSARILYWVYELRSTYEYSCHHFHS